MLFKEQVLQLIKNVPAGKVVSYGQLAAICGRPRAAREVGWILKSLDGAQTNIPWWRVVNAKGYLSIRGNDSATKDLQKQLLENEGVVVGEDYNLEMEKYRHSFVVI